MQTNGSGSTHKNGSTPKKGSAKEQEVKNKAAKARPVQNNDTVKRTVPTLAQLAVFLGIVIGKPLAKNIVKMFLKPLPAMSSLMQDTADQLKADGPALGLDDIEPAHLLTMKAQHRVLSVREAITAEIARASAEQRMQADDVMLKTLFRIHKRVKERGADDPDLLINWKFLMDFVKSYRPGRGPSTGGSGSGDDGGEPTQNTTGSDTTESEKPAAKPRRKK